MSGVSAAILPEGQAVTLLTGRRLMPGSHSPVYCSRMYQNAAESTNILGISERFSGILAHTGAIYRNV